MSSTRHTDQKGGLRDAGRVRVRKRAFLALLGFDGGTGVVRLRPDEGVRLFAIAVKVLIFLMCKPD